MRRIHLTATALALPVLGFALLLAGCSKDTGKSKEGDQTETTQPKATGPAKVLEPGTGVLRGKIHWKGTTDLAAATQKLHQEIAAKADQKDYCMKGDEKSGPTKPSETTFQQYRVGDNKLVGNVFIWIKPEPGTLFKVDKEWLAEAKDNPVVIHQPHCAFIPHSAITFATYHNDPKNPRKQEPTGQYVVFKNDAQVTHNTDYSGGGVGENLSLKEGAERQVKDFKVTSDPVRIKCGIHPWMNAYLWVVDTPFYTISRSDTLDPKAKDKRIAQLYAEPKDPNFGTYEIKNLPIGKVRVLAWHESQDWLSKGGFGGEPVEIKEGGTEKDFDVGK